ncbi:MAG: zinc ABC transporter substrate-binding protein [Anaerolineae bacterium]|nr:zinc ABC transporter substrate-binding protein [Anaerolineae bacterium]
MREVKFILATLLTILIVSARVSSGQNVPLNVLATTTIVADVAQNVAGDLFTVQSLLPPNTDIHAYEPTINDARRISGVDLILAVGAGYESFLTSLIENVGENIPVAVMNSGLELRALGRDIHAPEAAISDHKLACEAQGNCDPHTWMDPAYVIGWVNNIVEAFSAADPANARVYRANGDAYIIELEALDAEITEMIEQIPAARRILITNHEFLNYFADRYGFEVAGTVLPGVSTGGEPDPRSMAALIALIREAGVPAIFAEVSANPQLAETVAQEAGVQVITNLYSESLSDAEGDAPTYLDLMRHNAQAIAAALEG